MVTVKPEQTNTLPCPGDVKATSGLRATIGRSKEAVRSYNNSRPSNANAVFNRVA
jgi:hypothetical protein